VKVESEYTELLSQSWCSPGQCRGATVIPAIHCRPPTSTETTKLHGITNRTPQYEQNCLCCMRYEDSYQCIKIRIFNVISCIPCRGASGTYRTLEPLCSVRCQKIVSLLMLISHHHYHKGILCCRLPINYKCDSDILIITSYSSKHTKSQGHTQFSIVVANICEELATSNIYHKDGSNRFLFIYLYFIDPFNSPQGWIKNKSCEMLLQDYTLLW
jgi:hypothetical protein